MGRVRHVWNVIDYRLTKARQKSSLKEDRKMWLGLLKIAAKSLSNFTMVRFEGNLVPVSREQVYNRRCPKFLEPKDLCDGYSCNLFDHRSVQ